jgi:hypothetical protein
MRTLAILVNVLLLVLGGRLMLGESFVMNSSEVPLFLTMLAAPILSIIALLLLGAPNMDWLAKYCERKALEERQKLDRRRPQSAQCAPPNGGPVKSPDDAEHSGVPPSVS